MELVSRPWKPQDLLDDLQMYIDEEPDNYLNGRRTAMCMARDYLKEFFAREQGCEYCREDSLAYYEDLEEQGRLVFISTPSRGNGKSTLSYENIKAIIREQGELEKLRAERNALLDEIRGMCNLCKHYCGGNGDEYCRECSFDSQFEWRGLPEV